MTVILGLRQDGRSYLAADSQIMNGPSRISLSHPKIFEWGGFLVGASGYTRLTTLVATRAAVSGTGVPPFSNIYEAVDLLRELVLRDGWKARDGDDGPPGMGISLLVAGDHGLWSICTSWSVVQADEGTPIGVGQGSEYAEGAAAAFLQGGLSPDNALHKAIEVAMRYNVNCGGRIVTRSLP